LVFVLPRPYTTADGGEQVSTMAKKLERFVNIQANSTLDAFAYPFTRLALSTYSVQSLAIFALLAFDAVGA
jgi:hypothetical protein